MCTYAIWDEVCVICGRGIWVVPLSQAVWVPPEQEHEPYLPGDVALRNLFIEFYASIGLSHQCTVLKISPFLQN
jgi:hypothetical protein